MPADLHLVSGALGIVLAAISLYKIVRLRNRGKQQDSNSLIISYLVGEMTSHNGPVTITKIVGPHSYNEESVANRSPSEDSVQPWRVRRMNDDDRETQFFEWQWRERTEDNLGDAYYSPTGGSVFYNTGRGLATIKNALLPSRWRQFKKLSEHSDGESTERKYHRR